MSADGLLRSADGGQVRLTGHGDLDAAVVPALLPLVGELVAGASEVVLDLRGVAFLDSGGLRLVDALHAESRAHAAPFSVVAPAGTPSRRLLDLVGMTGLFDVREA